MINFHLDASILKALIYILLTIVVAIVVDNILRSLIRVPKRLDTRHARTFTTILRNIITVIVYSITVYIIFTILGVNLTPLLASAGIAGVLLGLAARPVFEDFISGFFLLSQESIAVGDYIKIDDVEGYIEAIQFRTLTLRMESGATCIIPNSMVKRILNFSSHRSHVIIDIPTKSDAPIATALKAMETALAHIQKDKDLETFILPGSTINGIEEFRPVGPMILRATLITYPSRRWEIARKYRQLVKQEFEKHKIHFG